MRALLPLAVAGALLAPATLAQAPAAAPLVSANPHRIDCGSDRPPLPELVADPAFDLVAYHVDADCKVDRALGYAPHGKPKILSDDAAGVSLDEAERWLERAAAAGAHYEHFSYALGEASGAMKAEPVSAAEDFPKRAIWMLKQLGRHATPLDPGGTLTRKGTELRWNGEPVTLMGFSWMGALAGRNFDVEGYLDVLARYGVNLTRVWAIEQWTAVAVEAAEPKPGNAAVPFAGSREKGWDLTQLSDDYFARVRSFVEAASERGIVVQLTLFDRHGLLNEPGDPGAWPASPYNRDLNRNPFLPPGPRGKAPPGFLERPGEEGGTGVGKVHRAFLRRFRSELGGHGNVIFEVMNEPLATDWPADEIVRWHRWVAGELRGGEGG